jgi:hypothetical protein
MQIPYATGTDPSLGCIQELVHTSRAIETMFKKGDTYYYHPDHHGEPEFRAAMVRAGYEDMALDVETAFKKGKRLAGLK